MKYLSDNEVARIIFDNPTKTRGALNHLRRKSPSVADVAELGAYCKKYDIRVEEIPLLAKIRDVLVSSKSAGIATIAENCIKRDDEVKNEEN